MCKYMKSHIGEIHKNYQGCRLKIIDGGDKNGHCKVRILDGTKEYEKERQYCDIKRGNVKNLYYPSLFEVGYFGVGKYSSGINGDLYKSYKKWSQMIRRCYDPYYINRQPTYKDVYVCDEWHNFQVFADWHDKNYREFDGFKTQLDKDLIKNGNKIYSPETCCYIPQYLNTFVNNEYSHNTSGYIGVSYNTGINKYVAEIKDVFTSEPIILGYFENPARASQVYNKRRKIHCEKMKEKCLNDWDINDKRILNNII